MKVVTKDLSWQSQRELWNREGHCAREACKSQVLDGRHTVTNLLYCADCCQEMVKWQGNIIEVIDG